MERSAEAGRGGEPQLQGTVTAHLPFHTTFHNYFRSVVVLLFSQRCWCCEPQTAIETHRCWDGEEREKKKEKKKEKAVGTNQIIILAATLFRVDEIGPAGDC